ncbi:helix-turn-helix transcriptional regulator [Pseudoalteromonas sp. C12FD-1]|uniref:helix-turn-helix transcriptional regulator n=1 Tax=Pseudoalteromonas sp. C12FD-1 TaxID=3131979 RepID=UPI00307D2D38
MRDNENFPYLGAYIKSEVIPKGTSVTKAAELLGVGRPALSNLLNGKASLSTDMAKRLEKVFNCSSKELLAKQSSYTENKASSNETPIITKTYVPPFLELKSNDIEQWASSTISARTRLPVFIRILVNSTGSKFTKVDFPGNDDGERPGWDGYIEAKEATPWIPKGRSGWEFGVNKDPKGKADGDFEKSVRALSEKDRAEMTFVFVTPRRWSGKSRWVESKKNEKLWGDVRAYDASDLEQWLEQSLAAQAWFANETRVAAKGVRTLDKCWADWANVSEPPLSKRIFNSAIQASKRTILSRLSKPVEGPTIIAADSIEEALAFISQLLSENGGVELAPYRDQTLVFDEPGTLSRLAESTQTFVPVIHNRKIEQELAPYAHKLHSIVVYPRNALNTEPHVILEPASYESFNEAMEDMGKNRDETQRLANESGRSPTVLRRRLSTVPAIKLPLWANEHQTKADLIPFLFVGAWNSKNEADKCGLELISDEQKYSQLERKFRRLAQLNDAPVWMTDGYNGVVSKLDLLFAISDVLTSEDLKRFFDVARIVLGEDNPALDLDEDKRWAASIYGKTREFSGVFRESVSETLVLISVHGDTLFKGCIDFSVSAEVSILVKELLGSPLTLRALEAHERDLPVYAEAAPDEFLSILESDLKSKNPAITKLLRPVGAGPFSHPSRTGLLWALEGLSWNPMTLPRAVMILAQLAQIEIDDNWANKPINSLLSIFKSWMPQTAANLETRIALVKRIISKYPYVGWKICIDQFDSRNTIGNYSNKPNWRTDGYGFGEPISEPNQIKSFIDEMVSLALSCNDYSLSMLTDLVDRLRDLSETDQERIWSIIQEWAETKTSDKEKALLREKIRVTLFSKRAVKRCDISASAKAVYQSLEPKDLLNRHSWLFQQRWLEPSANEVEDIDSLDFDAREEKVRQLRTAALREISDQEGIQGLLELASQGSSSWDIGWLCANSVLDKKKLVTLLKQAFKIALAQKANSNSQQSLISGAIVAIEDERERESIIHEVAENASESEYVELFLMAPFRKSTWKIVNGISSNAERLYWKQVAPLWIHSCEEENIEGVHRLLEVKRPRAAFACIQYHPDKLDVKVLYHLLSDIAKGRDEDSGQYRLDSYHVRKAFKLVNATPELSLNEKAGLEFAYMEMLSSRLSGDRSDNAIPNLEKYVEIHPEVFVQAITWAYKRKDGLSDPSEFQVPVENQENLANRGYHLIEALTVIPGHNDLGELETERLRKWIATVRESCGELSRSDIGDLCIGKLLSSSAVGKDGIWPCEEVREVIEDIQSEDIMSGMRTGLFNSRGATCRAPGEGGNQERELAEKYKAFGQKLLSSHPYVATKLLFAIAESYEYDAVRHDADVNVRARLVKG